MNCNAASDASNDKTSTVCIIRNEEGQFVGGGENLSFNTHSISVAEAIEGMRMVGTGLIRRMKLETQIATYMKFNSIKHSLMEMAGRRMIVHRGFNYIIYLPAFAFWVDVNSPIPSSTAKL
ncbi:hypothetical protein V6N12_043521 [Hibiscus sabdariffa]|uniref:RNase H type-1 domain-containing protein n=1 Tax=Hibiscus sabdariffa TaxID=183260 RepID=A0ABR2DEL1_9ROSI